MTPHDIRLAILNNNEDVKDALLTKNQIELIILVAAGFDTAAKLVGKKGFTIHNASASLTKLHKKGYLRRTETTHHTGGIEWVYSSKYKLSAGGWK